VTVRPPWAVFAIAMRILVTFLLLLAFGCATVRVPTGSIDEVPPASGDVAEPEVELWLEGGSAASPAETAEARKAARDALSTALARRHPDPTALGAEDPVLVVRERAVARTPARRREQTAAKIGMALGIVVVAAVAVVAVVAGAKHAGGSKSAAAKSAPAAKAAPVPAAIAPKARPAGAPAAPRPVARPVTRGAPVPHGAPHFAPGPPSGPVYAGPGAGVYWETNISFAVSIPFDSDVQPSPEVPLAPAPPPPADDIAGSDEPPPPPPPARLPEMEKLPLDKRGFFDGDETILEVDVVDRASGTVLYTKRVRGGADPRDRADIARLLDQALADLPR